MNKEEKAINKAKLKLFTSKDTAFFSNLLAQLKIEWVEHISTAATNGTHLYLNKDFVTSLNINELIGLLLHEVYHCALDHMNRAKSADLDYQIYNIAADYVINNQLDNMGYKLPEIGLIDHKYDGWSTRQVYDDIYDNADKIPSGFEIDIIMETPEGVSESEHHEEVLTNVIKAVTQARLSNQHGSIPGEIARRVEDIVNPKLPWEAILQDYMNAYKKEDYTWSRPNKRFWPDVYLPSMRSESLDQITVGLDVSGSISQKDLNAFMAEVRYIKDILQPRKLRIMSFDTKVRADNTFEEGESIEDFVAYGGGGTNINPLIKSVRAEEPEIVLIFTDGEFDMPDLSKVHSDMYWIKIGSYKFNPTKGEVIDFDS
jgi:predicted metal-dependent peptidase